MTGTGAGEYAGFQVEAAQAESKTLMVFPTKALAQDQLRGLNAFQEADLGFLRSWDSSDMGIHP